MKRIYIGSLLVLLILGGIGYFILQSFLQEQYSYKSPYRTATLPKDYALYDVILNSKYLYCDVRINDIQLVDNEGLSLGFSQGEISINEAIQNGENDISIDVAPWGFFADENKYSEFEKSKYPEHLFSKERFAEGAFCQVDIVVRTFVDKKKTAEEKVATLKIEINEDGQPIIAESSYQNNYPASPSDSIRLSTVKRKDIVKTEDVYELSRKLYGKTLPHWVWVDAHKYKDVPNNREQLEAAYKEVWDAFNERDEKKLRALLDISMYETQRGNSTLDPLDEEDIQYVYDGFGYENIFNEIKSMLPYDPTNFHVIEYAGGRIFRLADKQDLPPVRYDKKNGKIGYSNHYMSFIDGKFRIVR